MRRSGQARRTKRQNMTGNSNRNQFLADGFLVDSVRSMLPPRRAIWPEKRNLTLSFGTVSSLTVPNTSLAVERVYALNGLAQVDVTASSGTPFDWSDVTARYAKYCVMRARYIVRFFDPSADGTTVGIQWRGQPTTGNGYFAILSHPRCRAKEVSNTGEQNITFRGDVDMPQAFGVTKAEYVSLTSALVTSNPGVTAGTGSNDPNYTCFLRCWAIGASGVASTIQVECRVEFDVVVSQLLN